MPLQLTREERAARGVVVLFLTVGAALTAFAFLGLGLAYLIVAVAS